MSRNGRIYLGDPDSAVVAEYERALGRLTIRFSWLHLFLESFGWRVWRLQPDSCSIVTKDLQTKHLVVKLRETAKYAIPQDADRRCFLSILKKVEKAAERRNDLLHSLWQFPDESVIKINKKLTKLDIAPTAQEINQFSSSLTAIGRDLVKFMERPSLKP